MKKLLFCLLLILSLTFVSCKKKDPVPTPAPKPDVKVEVDYSTIQDAYYTDEFIISTIKLNVTKGTETSQVPVLPTMVKNLMDTYPEGKYTFNVTCEGVDVSFDVNFVNRPVYTEGLSFTFENGSYTVMKYNGTESIVTIPSEFNHYSVTKIGSNAFSNNQIIEEIVIPSTVKEIGNSAFNQCENLRRVHMSNNIETIGKAAFYQAVNLKSIYLPATIKSLKDKSLDSIQIVYLESSNTLEKLNDKNLNEKAYIYKDIKADEIYEAEEFVYIKNEDENGVTLTEYLGSDSCVEVTSLIDEHYNVTKLGAHIFSGMKNITEIYLPYTLKTILPYACQGMGISKVTFPAALTEIMTYAFSTCENLTTIKFAEGLKKIGDSAFASNFANETVILPNGLEYVGSFAFQNNYNNTSIFIPASVTFIGSGAFYSNNGAVIKTPLSKVPSTWDPNWNPSGNKVQFETYE